MVEVARSRVNAKRRRDDSTKKVRRLASDLLCFSSLPVQWSCYFKPPLTACQRALKCCLLAGCDRLARRAVACDTIAHVL